VEDQLAFYAQFYRGSNPSGEARFS